MCRCVAPCPLAVSRPCPRARNPTSLQVIYLSAAHIEDFRQSPVVSAVSREDAVLFLQTNCGTGTKREDVVRRLLEIAKDESKPWRVDARGKCMQNAGLIPRGADAGSVRAIMQQYKVSFSFENSEGEFYTTEKVYNALGAGMIPIYYGNPSIEEFIPHPMSIIDYRALGSPEALAAYLDAMMTNTTLFDSHHAWRRLPMSALSPGFQRLARMAYGPHTQCRMCEHVALWEETHGLS